MSQPTPYTQTTDFSQDEANNVAGRSTVDTAALDAEFSAISTTLGQTLANLALIQRDDGALADTVVTVPTLSRSVLNLIGGFTNRGAWAAATAYAVNDIVSNAGILYLCEVAHTSPGAFVESPNWSNFGFAGSEDAAIAAAQAAASATDAAASATAAGASQTAAGASQTAAAASASAAASSASSANASAGNASASASSASNSAVAAAASAAAITLPVPVASGGTGQTTASAALAAIGGASATTLAASGGSNLVGFIQSGTGATARTVQAKLRDIQSPQDFGATGAGVADDRAALVSANATGKPFVLPNGTYRVSTVPTMTVPIVSIGATVTPDSGSWLPRFEHDIGRLYDYTRKVNLSSDYSSTPTTYTYLDTFGNTSQRLINQAGYQQNFGSDSGGRTLVPVNYADVIHSGYGDCNLWQGAILVQQHGSAASVTKWVGQNSGTVVGGQVNAGTAQVNLYAEEYHLEDKGYNDVSGLGIVLDFYRTGAITKAYDTPWIGIRLMDAQGGNSLDAAVQVCNTWKVGIDFSQATLTSDKNAISLKANDRIYWGVDATAVASDQWYAGAGAAGLGTTWTAFDGTSLVTSVGNNPTLQLTATHAVVSAGAANDFAFRVFGNSATAFGSMGNIGAITYVSAASTGSDSTTLSLRTATAGVEADRLVIDSAGVMDYKHGATAASVAANFTATHYLQMKLNGVTYYVPARASTW